MWPEKEVKVESLVDLNDGQWKGLKNLLRSVAAVKLLPEL